MATTTVLSAMVVRTQERSFGQLWPSFAKAAPCSCCYQNGPSCSMLQRHHVQSDADGSRGPSRRDAIALFLQAALISVSNTNAQATESDFERGNSVEYVQAKNKLGMRVSVDVSSDPYSSPKLPLENLAGFMLAYQGAQKSSGSSLGLLGCLVFGLLFLKEKQARATNNTCLEDPLQLLDADSSRLFSVYTEASLLKSKASKGFRWCEVACRKSGL